MHELTCKQLDAIEARAKAIDLRYAQDGHEPTGSIQLRTNAALALVARAREADRLEGEADIRHDDLQDDLIEAEREIKAAEERAEAAESESARLRAVVEKLRKGLEPFGRNPRASSLSRCYAHLTREHAHNAAYLLAETAPDVPADQDGRAG